MVHELIAGAASYEAAKAYENHVAENGTYTAPPTWDSWKLTLLFATGEPPSHEKAKEILAGFAGAFVDREVESRGLDFVDAEKAKYQARQQVNDAYDNNGNQF